MDDLTIKYYNENINEFIDSTVSADVSNLYEIFLKYLDDGAVLLDLGCGSGRDTKAFLDMGYKVIATDGSMECCNAAKKITGQEVYCLDFAELNFCNHFDGIWACASLLHEKKRNLVMLFSHLSTMLKDNGVIYCSFKYGDCEGYRNGRFFTDMKEDTLGKIIQEVPSLSIVEVLVTGDVRKGKGHEQWLNAIIRKVVE